MEQNTDTRHPKGYVPRLRIQIQALCHPIARNSSFYQWATRKLWWRMVTSNAVRWRCPNCWWWGDGGRNRPVRVSSISTASFSDSFWCRLHVAAAMVSCIPLIVLQSFHRKTTTTASQAAASRFEVAHERQSCLVCSPLNMGSNRMTISVKLGSDALQEELCAAV